MSQPLDDEAQERVGALFQEHRSFIEAVAGRHASHPQDVPDIVQNVGVALCRHIDTFRGEAQIQTWLFRVTVNTARTHGRTLARRQRNSDSYERLALRQSSESPDDIVRQGERLDALREAVEGLRPSHRDAIRNLISESGVKGCKSMAFRARHELRIRLANDIRLE